MADPVKLSNVQNEPVPDVVQRLERALVEARAGRLRTIYLVGEASKDVYTDYSKGDALLAVGALELLKFDIIEQISETKVDVP